MSRFDIMFFIIISFTMFEKLVLDRLSVSPQDFFPSCTFKASRPRNSAQRLLSHLLRHSLAARSFLKKLCLTDQDIYIARFRRALLKRRTFFFVERFSEILCKKKSLHTGMSKSGHFSLVSLIQKFV